MKKILIFIACYALCATGGVAAVRDGNGTTRHTQNDGRTSTSSVSQRLISTQNSTRSTSSRTSVLGASGASRAKTQASPATTGTRRAPSVTRATQSKKNIAPETTTRTPTVTARATDPSPSAISETRTGAEYEQCKNAYFTCMDQFCQLKNDNYRRCSCSDRVFKLDEALSTITQAGEKLTAFTENLDVVGMTAAQASAMRNASEGENALTKDNSASKALLQAIMNSIRGKDATVGGQYSSLNSINMSFDTANAFGNSDAGQLIATYNGQNLYSAVYPSCRQAVRNDCNNASLQRAITAYLMAVEQDCNTVETAVTKKQKDMKSAIREGSAMLDLARVENRQKHNAADFTTCVNNVEAAILSEEVCGANYHKCLDNGEFIDISTGQPIAGVERFYELGNLLTFSSGIDAANQQLSRVINNRQFVQNFESRTKKFAMDALNQCVEHADDVWAEYLDRALLAIYYAQQSKVSEIKQTCFDYISACYSRSDRGLTAAISDLSSDSKIPLQPDIINLNTQLCQDYISSCNNMFDNNIIAEYVNTRSETDVKAACRAVAQQCFTKYGGQNYQNFYYPYSGTIEPGRALDWFTLYEYKYEYEDPTNPTTIKKITKNIKSECAKQLEKINSCSSTSMLEAVFGGFDSYPAWIESDKNTSGLQFASTGDQTYQYRLDAPQQPVIGLLPETTTRYGLKYEANPNYLNHHFARPTGVATEIYNQIIDILSTQCINMQGRFIEYHNIIPTQYNFTGDELCQATFENSGYKDLIALYGIGKNEDMCPRDYKTTVDTTSWGACLCWENGGRRSKWGQSTTCLPIFPIDDDESRDRNCTNNDKPKLTTTSATHSFDGWCTASSTDKDMAGNATPKIWNLKTNQVCPLTGGIGTIDDPTVCVDSDSKEVQNLPQGIIK